MSSSSPSYRRQPAALEYDTERAGTFDPLRFVPADKTVVLGLITTKHGQALESSTRCCVVLRKRCQFIDVAQLAISPQCGFASVAQGNLLSEAEQWDKLDLMMRAAEAIWGTP